jgi:hypothetical protein
MEQVNATYQYVANVLSKAGRNDRQRSALRAARHDAPVERMAAERGANMKLTVIHPPVVPNRRINWAAYQACGTIVPPPTPRPRGWGGLVFVTGIVALIGVPMLLLVTR